MLEAQRRQLLDQLGAIDRAITALGSAETEVEAAHPDAPDAPAEHTAGIVVPTQVKARRVLSDSHKQALIVGKRRARQAKNVASGLAREMPDDGFVPAIGRRGDRHPPRLVKRTVKK